MITIQNVLSLHLCPDKKILIPNQISHLSHIFRTVGWALPFMFLPKTMRHWWIPNSQTGMLNQRCTVEENVIGQKCSQEYDISWTIPLFYFPSRFWDMSDYSIRDMSTFADGGGLGERFRHIFLNISTTRRKMKKMSWSNLDHIFGYIFLLEQFSQHSTTTTSYIDK